MKNYKRDYFTEAHQLLKNQGYRSFIQKLLPGGKLIGNEWVAKNPTRNDKTVGSFSTNIRTGQWSDFATGDAGKDLIGWTAYIKGITPLEACFFIGVERPSTTDKPEPILEPVEEIKPPLQSKNPTDDLTPFVDTSDEQIEEEPAEESKDTKANDNNSATHPPLISSDDTDYFNIRKSFGLPSTFYPYQNALGIVVGYIVRWDIKTASGSTKKEVRPYIYDFTAKKWISKFFGQGLPNARPLYNLPELIANSDATVMIVEGEKAAEAAKVLFPDFIITTSSGGANQASKTDWHYLRGRNIIFAPDKGKAGRNTYKGLRKN